MQPCLRARVSSVNQGADLFDCQVLVLRDANEPKRLDRAVFQSQVQFSARPVGAVNGARANGNH